MRHVKILSLLILVLVAVASLLHGVAQVLALASLYISGESIRHFDMFTKAAGLTPVAAAFFWLMLGLVLTKVVLVLTKNLDGTE